MTNDLKDSPSSQASVDSNWVYLSGSEQSRIANKIDTLKVSCCPECGTVRLISHQSRPTCDLCAEIVSSPSPTSSSVDFPAKTSVLLELVKAFTASVQDSFSRSSDSLTKSSRRSSSSKMYQPFELADYQESSKSFPAEGICVGGRVYPQKKLEHPISAKDGSSWLPTPSATSYGSNKGGAAGRVGKTWSSLETMARTNRWPTPRSSDGEKGSPNQKGSKGDMTLPSAVHRWPTPTASDAHSAGSRNLQGSKAHAGVSLTDAVKFGNSNTARTQTDGGSLNPSWVEWLMGFPS